MLSRNLLSSLVIGSFSVLTAAPPGSQSPSSLTQEETAHWFAVGQSCQAPVTRIPSRDGMFDIYIESPAARAAVIAATATVMHLPLSAPGVKTALKDGHRIWVVNTGQSLIAPSIDRITVRGGRGEDIEAMDVRRERLFIGTVASHGIIEPLRRRFQEFIFQTLPKGSLNLRLHTRTGVQRYQATEQDRSLLMRVCNE